MNAASSLCSCWIVCLERLTYVQHEENEYGAEIGLDGQHTGGPFFIDVSPTMRVEDLRLVIQVSSRQHTL